VAALFTSSARHPGDGKQGQRTENLRSQHPQRDWEDIGVPYFCQLLFEISKSSIEMMKLVGVVSLLCVSLTQGWVPASDLQRSSVAMNLVSTTDSTELKLFVKPERVVREDLPTLYVYDHCPFCVRVRIALGVKNIKHNLHFMANDDVKTPTNLVGKKISPIFVSNSLCELIRSILLLSFISLNLCVRFSFLLKDLP
jgi:hypothetical protein